MGTMQWSGSTCPLALRVGLITNNLILFRRIEPNTYEFRVYPWGSDSARAIVDASLRANLLFRLGRNSSRLAGFLP